MNISKMGKHAIGAALMAVLVSAATLLAQAGPQPVPSQSGTSKPADKPLVPLKVQITLSRYEGEKKTSNLPFTLWVNANDSQRTELTVGNNVPVVQTVFGANGGNVQQSFNYRNLGTSLSCGANQLDDGRFRVFLNINDSSAAATKDTGGNPTFQSFTVQNYLLLRDGQTAQFVAATDKITGEVTKVDVTITVLK